MSADSFHHQVELEIKKKSELNDFADFMSCVSNAHKEQVEIKEME